MITCFMALPLVNVKKVFFGIDSSGFKSIHSSRYYTEKASMFGDQISQFGIWLSSVSYSLTVAICKPR